VFSDGKGPGDDRGDGSLVARPLRPERPDAHGRRCPARSRLVARYRSLCGFAGSSCGTRSAT
jgi:hypothetical protein